MENKNPKQETKYQAVFTACLALIIFIYLLIKTQYYEYRQQIFNPNRVEEFPERNQAEDLKTNLAFAKG
ncbi:MAG: hypothetical protein CM15mV90_080 [uncultured marine virus]|nr:MAG: hypothetical protein CM15mV90_080 [uncultured marine virus]